MAISTVNNILLHYWKICVKFNTRWTC